jgi:hypothetical protein
MISDRARSAYGAAGDKAEQEGDEPMGQELWLVVVSVGVLAVLSQFFGWGSSDQSGESSRRK